MLSNPNSAIIVISKMFISSSVFWSHQNFALCLFVHPFHVRIIFILDVLQVLFQAVLPAVSTDRLEECILSKVSGKVIIFELPTSTANPECTCTNL